MLFKNKNILFGEPNVNDQLSGDGDDDRDEKYKQMGVHSSETFTALGHKCNINCKNLSYEI